MTGVKGEKKKSFLCLNADLGALGITYPRWVVNAYRRSFKTVNMLYIVDPIKDLTIVRCVSQAETKQESRNWSISRTWVMSEGGRAMVPTEHLPGLLMLRYAPILLKWQVEIRPTGLYRALICVRWCSVCWGITRNKTIHMSASPEGEQEH